MKEMLAPYPPGLYHTMEPIPLMVSGTDFDKLLSIFYPSYVQIGLRDIDWWY